MSETGEMPVEVEPVKPENEENKKEIPPEQAFGQMVEVFLESSTRGLQETHQAIISSLPAIEKGLATDIGRFLHYGEKDLPTLDDARTILKGLPVLLAFKNGGGSTGMGVQLRRDNLFLWMVNPLAPERQQLYEMNAEKLGNAQFGSADSKIKMEKEGSRFVFSKKTQPVAA